MPKKSDVVKDYGLLEIIENDGSLKQEEKKLFRSLAKLFQEDFKENLKKTSIELDEKFQTNIPSEWRKFLNHTSIKNFLDGYIYEDMEKKAIDAMGGDNGFKESNKALKVKQVIDEKRKGEDNSNIVVMLLPRKPKNY